MADTTFLGRLKRLFSTNAIVRNVGGRKLKVVDTGKLQSVAKNSLVDRYQKLYSNMQSYGYNELLQVQQLRLGLFRDYESMDSDAIIAIDARGFIFGSAIAFQLSKPLILARKSGKLPGEILEQTYQLEYGNDSLAIQKKALNRFEKFIIVDDLLAKGGTVSCVVDIMSSINKRILGLSVVVELKELGGRSHFKCPVQSFIEY